MVRAGESGGVLDETLLRIADTLEKQVELRRKIRSAMTYPVVVLGLVVVIMAAMLIFIVPMFKGMYKTLGGTLPLPTRVLMSVSSLGVKLLPLLVVLAVAGVFLWRRWVTGDSGRRTWDNLKLRVPDRRTPRSQDGPVPILLDTVGPPSGRPAGSRSARDHVRSGGLRSRFGRHRGHADGHPYGRAVVQPIAGSSHLPPHDHPDAGRRRGQRGGRRPPRSRSPTFYEQEVEAAVSSLTSILEPLMVVVLGSAVGAMVIALYLPMFRIIELVK